MTNQEQKAERESQAAQEQTERAIKDARAELLKNTPESRVTVEADPPLEAYSFQKAAEQVREDSGAALAGNPATYEYQRAHPEEEAKRLELERAIYGNTGAAPLPKATNESQRSAPLNPVVDDAPPPPADTIPSAPRRSRP